MAPLPQPGWYSGGWGQNCATVCSARAGIQGQFGCDASRASTRSALDALRWDGSSGGSPGLAAALAEAQTNTGHYGVHCAVVVEALFFSLYGTSVPALYIDGSSLQSTCIVPRMFGWHMYSCLGSRSSRKRLCFWWRGWRWRGWR